MVRLKDGRLVMITRPEGAISWSEDNGHTWTPPVTFGFRMFAPTLQVLSDGTLLCHYGCYNAGGLRAIFSSDGREDLGGASQGPRLPHRSDLWLLSKLPDAGRIRLPELFRYRRSSPPRRPKQYDLVDQASRPARSFRHRAGAIIPR